MGFSRCTHALRSPQGPGLPRYRTIRLNYCLPWSTDIPLEATRMLPSVLQAFIGRSPICVMAQAVLENLFQPERLDELFERTAQQQYKRTLLFSSVVELMHSVVLGVEPSVYAAYRKRRHTLQVSDQAVYDKLDRMEL